jgi:hypothetical protein
MLHSSEEELDRDGLTDPDRVTQNLWELAVELASEGVSGEDSTPPKQFRNAVGEIIAHRKRK